MRGPNIRSWNSERTMPSPCSPECEPLYSATMAKASSAMARNARTSLSWRRLSTGRTCSSPTEAWAYQVPSVPWRAKSAVSRSVKSARSSSGTAQSSTKETGFPSLFIDIMMLRPWVRTSVILACRPVSIASSTPPSRRPSQAKPRSDIRSCRADRRRAFSAGSSSANSTSRSAAGSPRTKASSEGESAGISRPSSIIVRSTSSTAAGRSATMCCVASIASRKVGKWQTPTALCRGRGASRSSMVSLSASVPSEPTKRCAMLLVGPSGTSASML